MLATVGAAESRRTPGFESERVAAGGADAGDDAHQMGKGSVAQALGGARIVTGTEDGEAVGECTGEGTRDRGLCGGIEARVVVEALAVAVDERGQIVQGLNEGGRRAGLVEDVGQRSLGVGYIA